MFIYWGHISERNLKALVERHSLNLWSIGSQLILSKCSVPMCCMLSNCKQKRIHLFCKTYNLFLYSLFQFGYHATQAWSKCGWISALHKSLFKSFERNLFFLYKSFSFEVTFLQTYITIDSPVRHSCYLSISLLLGISQ